MQFAPRTVLWCYVLSSMVLFGSGKFRTPGADASSSRAGNFLRGVKGTDVSNFHPIYEPFVRLCSEVFALQYGRGGGVVHFFGLRLGSVMNRVPTWPTEDYRDDERTACLLTSGRDEIEAKVSRKDNV